MAVELADCLAYRVEGRAWFEPGQGFVRAGPGSPMLVIAVCCLRLFGQSPRVTMRISSLARICPCGRSLIGVAYVSGD